MKQLVGIICLWVSFPIGAVDVVSERDSQCERLELTRELKIFKDPSMFLPNLAQLYADPQLGLDSLLEEDPLITRRKGEVSVMRLGEPALFRNFGYISKLYGMEEPRLDPKHKDTQIIAVRICGEDAYADSLGFILEEDLKKAQMPRDDLGPPPSVQEIPSEIARGE